MNQFLRVALQAWLASAALAAPGLEQKPRIADRAAACNADNCLRAVRATNMPRPTDASADCSSFLMKTVTPCPAIRTTTTTITSTTLAPASISLVTQIVQEVSTETVLVPFETTVTTIEDIVGLTATSTIVVPETTTVTVTAQPANSRRAIASSAASGAGATCPAANGASAVPTYASACSGAARYSSACSCYGVTAGTVTGSQATSTATTTVVTTVTPTATVTVARTQVSVLTDLQPTAVPRTLETTETSVVATVAVTQTTQVTVTTTVTPSVCTTYAPYATNGAYAGHALGRSPAGIFTFQPGMSNPQLLVIQSDGRLRNPAHPNYVAAYRNPSKSVVIFIDPTDPTNQGWTPLNCRVGDPLNQSGIFPLYCDGGIFETCPNDATIYFATSVTSSGGASCEEIDLGVFKACTTPYNS